MAATRDEAAAFYSKIWSIMNTLDQEKFGQRTVEALAAFPKTVGRCANLCAYISEKLRWDDVDHLVALGSLSCNGVKVFQYRKPFPQKPKQEIIWDGHAWIEFPDGSIGDVGSVAAG